MIVVGIDHHRAPSALIARVAAVQDDLVERVRSLPCVHGVVALATCARVELYVDATRFHDVQRTFVAALAEVLAVDPLIAESYVDARRSDAALAHLFEVTAGLQSAVLGETQIAGQVRGALTHARAAGTVSRPLAIAFEQAQAVSRRVRAGLPARTLVGTALEQIGEVHQGLVIGTGEYAAVTVRELRARGASRIASFSRHGRMAEGADFTVDADELVTALALADVVVTCSGGGGVVLTDDVVDAALHLRAQPLTIVDLSGGIDVALSVTIDPDIRYLDLDAIGPGTLDQTAVAGAHCDIEAAVQSVLPRIIDTELDDVIVALRSHVIELAEEFGTDEASAEAVRRFAQALLHEPTVRARSAAQRGQLDEVRHALHALFDIAATSVSTGRAS